MALDDAQGEPLPVEHHAAVVRGVEAVFGIPGHGDAGGDVAAAVLRVVLEDRQPREVAGQFLVVVRLDELRLDRVLDGLRQPRDESVGRDAERESCQRAARAEV